MTEREKFEKWCKANKYTALYFSDNMYFDKATQMAWKAWQAAKATSFTLPDRMDYELHGDTVISNPFVDGYNQALSDVISMNEEYANSTGSDGWIPVSDLPKEAGRYWCYVEYQTCLSLSHYQWNCSWNGEEWGGDGLIGKVTHWMPLPAAPEQPE